MTARPGGALLIDSENVFKPFLPEEPKPFNPDAKYAVDARKLNRHDVPLEEIWREGPAYLEALVGWLERRFELLSRRSYGKHHDPGVKALYRAIMRAQSWTHTDVPPGKDKADEAIIEDLDLFALNPRYTALVVASSDAGSVLAKLDAIAAEGWHRCVAITGPATLGRWRFQEGGGLEHLRERYTLAQIFAEESRLRTESKLTEALPTTEVAPAARTARKKHKARTAAQKRALYAQIADDLHRMSDDDARSELGRRFNKAADSIAIASIQASLTNAVKELPDDDRRRELLDAIGDIAEGTRIRLGEKPE